MRITCELPGKPIPCPRPRVDRGRTHYTAAYDSWRETAKVLLRDACIKQNGGRLIEGPVKVSMWFHGPSKTADIDNLQKSVLDALQGTVVVNDRLAVETHAWKCAGDERKTVVIVEVLR